MILIAYFIISFIVWFGLLVRHKIRLNDSDYEFNEIYWNELDEKIFVHFLLILIAFCSPVVIPFVLPIVLFWWLVNKVAVLIANNIILIKNRKEK